MICRENGTLALGTVLEKGEQRVRKGALGSKSKMKEVKGERFYVRLGASQARKRLRGVGFGVRKVESAGTGRALIIHTATGEHLCQLKAVFRDVLEAEDGEPGTA